MWRGDDDDDDANRPLTRRHVMDGHGAVRSEDLIGMGVDGCGWGGWTLGRTGGWIVDGWIDDGWIDGWVDGWVDG